MIRYKLKKEIASQNNIENTGTGEIVWRVSLRVQVFQETNLPLLRSIFIFTYSSFRNPLYTMRCVL